VNKKERKQVIDFLLKINSEGMEYYFNEYISPANIEKKYPFLQDTPLMTAIRAYKSAHSDLVFELGNLTQEYEISPEEIEY
jgi:hypothetical protein